MKPMKPTKSLKPLKQLCIWLTKFALLLLKTVGIKGNELFILPPAGGGSLGDEALLAGLITLNRHHGKDLPLRQALLPGWTSLNQQDAGLEPVTISLRDTQSRLSFLAALRHCRHFGVLGADIIDGRYASSLVKDIVEMCNIVVETGGKATIFGFSFSTTPDENAVQALRTLDPRVQCYCRDEKALQRFTWATRHDATLVADLAFHLQPHLKAESAILTADWIRQRRGAGQIILGFNANILVSEGLNIDAARAYSNELTDIMRKNEHIACVFLPHDLRVHQSDYSIALQILALLPKDLQDRSHIIAPPFHAWDMKALAGLCDLVISGRMHLTIAALSQGTPAIGLTYQGKFEGLFEYFNAVDLLFSPQKLGNAGALSQHVLNTLPLLEEYKTRIKDGLPNVRDLSARNILNVD